jgi:dephospho-CoA kinase
VAVVAVAGRIGAGKSQVADAVATAIGASKRSFGAAVRAIAEDRGLPTDRESLQELGEETIAVEGWTAFVSRVQEPFACSMAIDGVRHLAAAEALRRGAEGTFLLVFVDASFERRLARLAARDGITRDQLLAADQHRNESEVIALREIADIVIYNEHDGRDVLAVAVDAIVEALEVREEAADSPETPI